MTAGRRRWPAALVVGLLGVLLAIGWAGAEGSSDRIASGRPPTSQPAPKATPTPPPSNSAGTNSALTRGRQGTAPWLDLVDQDPWLGPRGTFSIDVQTAVTGEGYTLEARLHQAIDSRQELLTTADTALTPTIGRIKTDEVVDTGTQSHRIEVAVVPDDDGTEGYPFVLDPGVYPIEVSLLDPDGEVAQSLVTHLVHLPEELVNADLPVGLLVDVRQPIRRDADGVPKLDRDTVDRLTGQLDALGRFADVPFTVQIQPETVSALITTRAGVGGGALSSLGRLAATSTSTAVDVLPTSYVSFDEAGWLADQYSDVLQGEFDAGRASLTGATLRQAPDLFSLSGNAEPAVLSRYFDFGIRRLVLPDVAAGPTETTGAGVRIGPGPHLVRELPDEQLLPAADFGLVPAGDDAQLGTLDAHRLLAALLLDALNGNNSSHQVRLDGSSLDLNGSFTATLLKELSRSGPLRATTIDGLFDEQDHFAEPASWRADQPPRGASGERGPQLADTSRQIAGLRSMVDDPDLIAAVEARLLLVPARDLDEPTVSALLDAARRTVATISSAVVMPEAQSFTVTSHKALLPLVVRNDGERAVQVGLRLRSQELEFTGANPIMVTLEPGPNDLEIPVQTRRSGEFEFAIDIISPDQSITLGVVDVRVQSRAVSGVGAFLSAGSLLFLVVWWIRNARRRRALAKAGGPVPAEESTEWNPPDALDESEPPVAPPLPGATPEQSGRR